MENNEQILAKRQQFAKSYASARSNLLLAIILTVVNIVLFFAESGTMLLFSVSVPYYAVFIGFLFDALEIGIGVAAVVLIAYLLCWLFSKKNSGWLVVAAVLFAVDTLAMAGLYLLMEDMSGIMDAVIHICVMYYLVVGIRAAAQLKKLPEVTQEMVTEENALAENSTPLRPADVDVKHRVLLESEYGRHQVCYRRVGKVNELVIDGQVYDEYEARMEMPHSLTARIGGHTFEVGYGNSRSYFFVDGQQIESKIRWY